MIRVKLLPARNNIKPQLSAAVAYRIPVTEYDRVNFGLAAERLTVNTYKGAPKRYADFINQYGKGDGSGVGNFKGWLYKGTIGWAATKPTMPCGRPAVT